MWKNIGTGGVALGKILGRLAFYTWVPKNYNDFKHEDDLKTKIILKSMIVNLKEIAMKSFSFLV